jgi:hypothetical protein
MGIKRARLQPRDGKYIDDEAHRYLPGTFTGLPSLQLPMVDAAGGWVASVVDMARFLTSIEGSRGKPVLKAKTRKLMLEPPPDPLKPRKDGTYFSLGWDSAILKDDGEFAFFKDGSLQGMRTFMKRLATGVSWALLYNASMEFDPHDLQLAGNCVHEVRQLVEGLEKHPDVDLFGEYQ